MNFEDTKVLDENRKSFSQQAAKFASYHMSKKEYTDYLISRIDMNGSERALEVACGTCICGRALAPHVQSMECLDLTREMLTEGKRLAEEEGLTNMTFTEANAEHMPYEDNSFDLVVTRLSLHHFAHPEIPFAEMKRVLKKGGKLVVWDMEATDEDLREIDDKIERMRDPSHTRILGSKEFETLYADGFDLTCEEVTYIPVNLQSWMNLTGTPVDVQEQIVALMKADLAGGPGTGFHPYLDEKGRLSFHHRWLLLIGVKQ